LLDELVHAPVGAPARVSADVQLEVDIAKGGHGDMSKMDRIGRRSVLACPDCHGVMWEIDEGELTRFRCHVGHAYTAELMSLALDENLTRALASALRALDERVSLAQKLHRQETTGGRPHLADAWARKVSEFEKEAKVIREAIRRKDDIAVRFSQNQAAERSQARSTKELVVETPREQANKQPRPRKMAGTRSTA
jgi:two-component system chemotaxis response regulator CheB